MWCLQRLPLPAMWRALGADWLKEQRTEIVWPCMEHRSGLCSFLHDSLACLLEPQFFLLFLVCRDITNRIFNRAVDRSVTLSLRDRYSQEFLFRLRLCRSLCMYGIQVWEAFLFSLCVSSFKKGIEVKMRNDWLNASGVQWLLTSSLTTRLQTKIICPAHTLCVLYGSQNKKQIF